MFIKDFIIDIEPSKSDNYILKLEKFDFQFSGSFVVYDSEYNIICCSEDRWLSICKHIKNKPSDKKVKKEIIKFLSKVKNKPLRFYKINIEDYLFDFENNFYLLFFKDAIEDDTFEYTHSMNCGLKNVYADYNWLINKQIEDFDVSSMMTGIIQVNGRMLQINYFFKILQNNEMIFSSYDLRNVDIVYENIEKVESILVGECIISIEEISKLIIVISLSNNKQIYIFKDNKLENGEFISKRENTLQKVLISERKEKMNLFFVKSKISNIVIEQLKKICFEDEKKIIFLTSGDGYSKSLKSIIVNDNSFSITDSDGYAICLKLLNLKENLTLDYLNKKLSIFQKVCDTLFYDGNVREIDIYVGHCKSKIKKFKSFKTTSHTLIEDYYRYLSKISKHSSIIALPDIKFVVTK